MYDYSRNLQILHETPTQIPTQFQPNKKANKELIDMVLNDNRTVMTEFEAKQFLANYHIPVSKNGLAKTEAEAITMSEKFGYPLVMKIASPDILHKTDVGGVILKYFKIKKKAKSCL